MVGQKKTASIRLYVLNLILICTFMMLSIEYTAVHIIFDSES